MPSYKTPQINFVCTEEQYKIIKTKADENNMSLAEYCRFVALNAHIEVKVKEEPK